MVGDGQFLASCCKLVFIPEVTIMTSRLVYVSKLTIIKKPPKSDYTMAIILAATYSLAGPAQCKLTLLGNLISAAVKENQ